MPEYDYLILPDLHNRIEIHQRIIDAVPAAQRVHLGDYWDQFHDTPADAELTAEWVRSRQEAGDCLLIGNHDIYYLYGNSQAMCSGNTYDKLRMVRKHLDANIIREFFLHVYIDRGGYQDGPILMTHAGLSRQMVPAKLCMHKALHRAEKEIREGKLPDIACQVGARRGGRWLHGGVLWEDVGEFSPVPGIRQIFGHTPIGAPRKILGEDGLENWCIDTHSEHFATVDSKGVIEIHRTLDFI